jgi:serine kinase of HPr protein (carbohydrate metabolism regulator)
MTVNELAIKTNLKIFTGNSGLQNTITGGYVSDLLSDVMGNAQQGNVWITLQNHLNVVAIASLRDLACIVLVKSIEPPAEVIEKAIDENIAILGSKQNTFELTAKIHQMINK